MTTLTYGLHWLVGLGGVDKKESIYARTWDRFILYLMLLVVLSLLTHWSYRLNSPFVLPNEIVFNLSVWLLFVIDVCVAFCLVKKKVDYLKKNWLKLILISLIIPPLFDPASVLMVYRFLDPFFALLLLTTWSDYIWRSLSDNRLLTTLVSFFAVIIVSGFLMAGIDPAIQSPWQGFWCVLVTMSTVGYGDYVPTSFMGQLFAAVLILMGLGFFAIVTANFAELFLRRDVEVNKKNLIQLMNGLADLKVRDAHLVEVLNAIEKRLDKLEKRKTQ